MLKILALDLATNIGFHAYDCGGHFKLPAVNKGMFLNFYKILRSIVNKGKYDVIAFEDVHPKGAYTFIFNGLKAIVYLVAFDKGCKLVSYKPREIKKRFTGDGGSDKDAMIEEAKKRGYDPINHDHADAIAIYELVKEDLDEKNI